MKKNKSKRAPGIACQSGDHKHCSGENCGCYCHHDRSVYSYAPDGCVAYDVDTPEGAASAHRADTMAFPYRNAYEY